MNAYNDLLGDRLSHFLSNGLFSEYAMRSIDTGVEPEGLDKRRANISWCVGSVFGGWQKAGRGHAQTEYVTYALSNHSFYVN